MVKKTIGVTVGIPTYSAEQNIGSLLSSIIRQKQSNFILREVLLYSDGNVDNTVAEAKKIKSKKIIIFDMKKRKGMAFGLKYMLQKAKSDLFLLLNDDILVKDQLLISKMVSGYMSTKGVGLLSGNPQPLQSNNFLVQAQISAFNAFERSRYLLNGGQNKYTCDGKILMIVREMWEKIKFPKTNGALGNVDVYLYMFTKKIGLKYKHVRSAKVYFELPQQIDEYIKWSSRNNANGRLLEKQFGKLVREEYQLPLKQHSISKAIEFIKNPLGTFFLFLVGLYAKRIAIEISNNFSPTWEVIESTKRKL